MAQNPRRLAPEREPLLPSQLSHTDISAPSLNHLPQNGSNKPTQYSSAVSHPNDSSADDAQKVEFSPDDPENPRNWTTRKKRTQILQICLIAFVCPMASSILAPAVDDIAATFGAADRKVVLLGQSVFVAMLGIGPLFLAPMSETFGRRVIFLGCLAVFAVLQVGTAASGNVQVFVALRLLSGLFGSVGVANGGGTVTDMFEKHERAQVLGVYLICPLLGPSIGPMIGGIVVGKANWRWIFWVLSILAILTTMTSYFFLFETRAITLLQQRKRHLERKYPNTKFSIDGVPNTSIFQKIVRNSTRAVKILTTQPIVMVMSLYQALVFSTMYTLYAQYSSLWSQPPYNFNKTQLGLTYLGPALGFIINAIFIVTFIDKVYSRLAERNGDDGQPEYRLPLANIGAALLPVSLFWFGWAVEKQSTWQLPLTATLLFGASQVSIFNAVQTYYIDAYESNAASALAAGAFLRSMVGGIVPLFVSGLFESLGYGWGLSVFGFLSVVLMPAPLLFQWIGRRLRERFPFEG